MRHPVASAFGVFAVAAGSLMLLAAPASAQNGPPEVGCTTGSSCMIELNYDVTYTGSSGGSNGVVITPPPCIGVPAGDAHTGSEAIISLYGNNTPLPSSGPSPLTSPSVTPATPVATGSAPGPTASVTSPAATSSPTATASPSPSASPSATGSPAAAALSDGAALLSAAGAVPAADPGLSAQQQQLLAQAEQLVGTNPIAPGEWYQITGNPYASTAAQQKCNNLPPYVWAAGNNGVPKLDGLDIPAQTLAELAYSQLTTAQLSTATLDPKGTSDTNLPTFVDDTLLPPARGVLSITAQGNPYVWATATTPDGQSATVWAWATGLTINPGTPAGSGDATTFDVPRCSTAHQNANSRDFVLGSRYTQKAMALVGVDQQIDCGVTYSAPGTYELTASVSWSACWAAGLATTDGPPATGCKTLPGLTPKSSPAVKVNVREIQSVNNS